MVIEVVDLLLEDADLILRMNGKTGRPVSYTHLDVYKRQAIPSIWGIPV